MCLYPKLILNPKYKPNKKNGGNIPAVRDQRMKYVPIGCQSCLECRKQKARDWKIRLMEDIKQHKNARFITLTFNNESYSKIAETILNKAETKPTGYQLDNAIATYAVRHWLERYRKQHKTSIRHWLVTELGHEGTENIHLHGIIYTDTLKETIKHWKYGYVWAGYEMPNGELQNYVNDKTITYITKYVTKQDIKHPNYQSIILTSAGIGNNFKTSPDIQNHKYKGDKTREYYRTRTGLKVALPIYFRNILYNENEREELWLKRIEEGKRYVLGEPIDIKNGEQEYYKALKHAQQLNKELGYEIKQTWEQQQYEREIRILKQQERIAKGKKKKKNANDK